MTQPKRPLRSDPTAARLGAWWNPKSRCARLAALDIAQEAGYARTPTGAWHAMRDAAGHEASANPAALERRDREGGQTRIQNLEPEPDDEQDLGR